MMIVNKLERMLEEAVVAYFKAYSAYKPEASLSSAIAAMRSSGRCCEMSSRLIKRHVSIMLPPVTQAEGCLL
jgi:hypothetical protein